MLDLKPIARTMATGMAAATIAATTPHAAEFELTGYVEPEVQYFTSNASSPRQENENVSIAGELTAQAFWDEGNKWIVAKPFVRLDLRDDRRTHVDMRELKYGFVQDDWEVKIGLDKVFWGVTEAAHLVDIINQSDLVESIDGEEKLGQPMLHVSTVQDFGIIDLFILPYFRERTFAGPDGRPATDIPVDTSLTRYESDDEERHVDFALRYSNTFDIWDVGVSYFQGTNREPILTPGLSALGDPVLIPFYAQIRQASVDIQATQSGWLYKFEGFWREQLNKEWFQATGGIEYTFYGVFGTPGDVGVVAEYIFDGRGAKAPNPFNDDAFVGLRWTANDVSSTSILAGTIVDVNTQALAMSLEAERRMGDDYLVSFEGRFFGNVPVSDPLRSISDDDLLRLRVARYF